MEEKRPIRKEEVQDIGDIKSIHFVRPGYMSMSNLAPDESGLAKVDQTTLAPGGKIHRIDINLDVGIVKITYSGNKEEDAVTDTEGR
ncbi:hypothetical protein LCGC14_0245600 [marine sediment metagenome]|uniref:Uncharacterized protein n=1 Tax=marine sediment metagenome TaxID=412755 RepID=A0A0F9UAI4_9ZZZZ